MSPVTEPTGSAPGTARRIVVGVDGSPASRQALRWAVRQAGLISATVDAVIAWRPPVVFGWHPPAGTLDVRGTASTVLRDAVRQVLAGEPAVPVREHVVEGHPARVLADAACGAELLVVGNRGYSGLTGAVLGSVGQHCVRDAPCPVVVVRAPRD